MKPGSRQKNLNSQLDRRRFIQGSAVTALTAAASCAGPGDESAGRETAIELENRKPGTRDWQLTRVWVDRGKYRSARIEGYCSHQSIEAGDTLSIFVGTEPASPFRVDIYRLGYYGGHGGRLMKSAGPLEGKPQPLPEVGPNRLRECRWEPSLEFTIPEDWTSGVYLGKLSTLPAGNQPYWQSYVIFIVRDRRPAHLLFQCSDNTWQAYNRWPNDYSLYTHPEGAHHPGVAGSFDRPYAKFPMFADFPLSVGTGEFLLWEYPLCYWLEREGLDVTYCSNADVLESSFVTRCRAFVSVGHDEYWTYASTGPSRPPSEKASTSFGSAPTTSTWSVPSRLPRPAFPTGSSPGSTATDRSAPKKSKDIPRSWAPSRGPVPMSGTSSEPAPWFPSTDRATGSARRPSTGSSRGPAWRKETSFPVWWAGSFTAIPIWSGKAWKSWPKGPSGPME